jgi:hypothetical protein
MSAFNNLDEIFNEGFVETSVTTNTNTNTSKDGLYRPDLTKVKPEHKKRGYRSVIRFIRNYTDNPELIKNYLAGKGVEYTNQSLLIGKSQIEKRTHYVKIESPKELKGYYDSPSNVDVFTNQKFAPSCELSGLKKSMKDSKNAVWIEKQRDISYSSKTFSYVLILEDEQQPELVGKVMIWSYGKPILDKIESEEKGTYGEKCNVFKLEDGKDFVLIITEKEVPTENGKTITMPDYSLSSFKGISSSISMPVTSTNDVKTMKNVPLNESGRIPADLQEKIISFLLKRDAELESFAPKRLTELQLNKIEQIKNYYLGKPLDMSKINPTSVDHMDNKPSSDDFTSDIASSQPEKVLNTNTSTNSNTDDDDDIPEFDWTM